MKARDCVMTVRGMDAPDCRHNHDGFCEQEAKLSLEEPTVLPHSRLSQAAR